MIVLGTVLTLGGCVTAVAGMAGNGSGKAVGGALAFLIGIVLFVIGRLI